MALWDYFAPAVDGRDGPRFIGLSDERLAAVRAQYPRGRAVESVAHLPRVPGDDETDHVLRHRYGIDPSSYQATHMVTRSGRTIRLDGSPSPRRSVPATPAPRVRAPKKPAAREPRARQNPDRRPRKLSRLVRLALREAPTLGKKLDSLVRSHERKRSASSRHSFLGMPLTIRSTRSGLSIAFASER